MGQSLHGDGQWLGAIISIGVGLFVLSMVRFFLETGWAEMRGVRAKRGEDMDFWTITAIYAVAGLLFLGIGLLMLVRIFHNLFA